MKTFITNLFLVLILSAQSLFAQKRADKVLFSDTSVINASLSMNLKKIRAESAKPGKIFPALFSCKMGDSININDPVSLEVRGHFRRDYCYLPPLKMIFKDHPNATFYKLKSLKLVSSCMIGGQDEQNLLKEYMCYKIYNMMTDMSFKARLLNLTYVDSSRKKPLTRHAFLLEDVKQVAKRNNCDDWSDKKIQTEKTNRSQMTMVAIFEYMIANTDWSVPADHNIRLIHSKTDSSSRPYVVPYDFDFSGLVNTSYSAPDERLGISTVRERIYRGFPRTMDE
ncbi:MAG TPA: hypothetical protein VHS53_09820, partial [Mucilaginibacter sp.]|nr:hypothetical protein [Mucilaginibacter sp.]